MAIQVRRGKYEDFDPSKLLPGEWAAVLEGDPATPDGRSVYVCFKSGDVKRMATYNDLVNDIEAATDDVVAVVTDKYTAELVAAEQRANAAAQAAEEGEAGRSAAEEGRNSAQAANDAAQEANNSAQAANNSAQSENNSSQAANDAAQGANNSAQSGNDSAQALNDAAQANNDTAQAKNNADQALNNQQATSFSTHICEDGEYDPATGLPTVDDPSTSTLYLVPTGDEDDEYNEFLYTNSKWNPIGKSTAAIEPIQTDQIDAVADDEAPVGAQVLNLTGLSYLWAKLKAAFAALAHTHSATDITSGMLPVNRGGTGATGAEGARTNLDVYSQGQVDSALANLREAILDAETLLGALGTVPIGNGGTGAATAADAAAAIVNGQSIAPANVAATGDVSDSVGSMAQLRESVYQYIDVPVTIGPGNFAVQGYPNVIPDGAVMLSATLVYNDDLYYLACEDGNAVHLALLPGSCGFILALSGSKNASEARKIIVRLHYA